MINNILNEHINTVKYIAEIEPTLLEISALINDSLLKGNKLLIMGNGGSAADSQHFAAEIVGRYKIERSGYPAIALTTDTSILTSIGNDYSFEKIFSRQIEALCQEGDIVIGLSTSGNSRNVEEGFLSAKRKNCNTIGLLGKDGGILKNCADHSIIIPSENTARIQECHILIIHLLCDLFEEELKKNAEI